jgi:ATP-dependent exoDNAse (exonuclease V) beta subunit
VTRTRSLVHLLIRASAGTGKTFQLSNRYLALLLCGQPPDRILATTFTRKAAGEILDRIVRRLARAAGDPNQTAELAESLELPTLTQQDCRQALRRLTTNLHRVRVSTLDSYFLSATQAASLELGLPPSWQIVDEADLPSLREEAIARLLAREDIDYLRQLFHWLTKGTTQRSVRQLLASAIEQMYALYLAADARAWRTLPLLAGSTREDLARVEAELQGWLTTGQVTKRWRNAVERVIERLATEDWNALAKNGIVHYLLCGETTYAKQPIPAELVQHLAPLTRHVRAQIQNEIVRQTQASFELLDRYHAQFEQLKLERRVLEFDDMARRLGKFDVADPVGQFAFRLDCVIDNLLLDEFQDTSLSQWNVLQPLAQHTSGRAAGRSFLCVGDRKQAIYGWRGGDADLLDAVAAVLPALEPRALDRSFRSAPVVIDFVNQVHRHLNRHPRSLDCAALHDWSVEFPLHTTSLEKMAGHVSLQTTDYASTIDERRRLANDIAVKTVRKMQQAAPHLTIGVLVTTNECVGQVKSYLQRAGINASEEGGNPLVNSAGVQLVVSLLKLTDHPQDSAARFHLATSPWAAALGLTDYRDAAAAMALSRRVQFDLANFGFGEVVRRWVDQLQPFTNAREQRRLSQLVEMAHEYQRQVESPRDIGFESQYAPPIATAPFVALVEQRRVADPTADPVRVMTVHQAKGLEFDVVILPDLERKLIAQTPVCVAQRPSATQPIETVLRYIDKDVRKIFDERIERVHERDTRWRVREALCLLYVAMTRAVHCLQMIIPPDAPPQSKSGKQSRDADNGSFPFRLDGLLRASLSLPAVLPEGQTVFESGDPNWYLTDSAKPADVVPSTASPLPAKIQLRPSTRPTTRRDLRPSDLRSARERLAGSLSLANQSALQRGTLIHAFLERIEWLDDGPPDDAALAAVGRSLGCSSAVCKAAIAEFQRCLKLPTIRAALCRARYHDLWASEARAGGGWRYEVRREQRLALRVGDDWLSGSIDRLVVIWQQDRPQAAEILDFKTDAVDSPAALAAAAEQYRPQLLSYRRGIARMLHLPDTSVGLSLLFVFRGQEVNVEPLQRPRTANSF